MNRAHRILVLALVCALATATLNGAGMADRYSRASLFFSYYGWTADYGQLETSLNQTVSGLSLNHVASDKLELSLWSSLSANSLTAINDTEISLSAFNDVRLAGNYYLSNRLVVLGLNVNLPTGKKELSGAEYGILVSLADNARKYVVRRLGQGFNVGAEAFVRPEVGQARFIAGGGFLMRGPYQVLAADNNDYNYGDEIYGRVGIMREAAPTGYGLTIELRMYGKDTYGDGSDNEVFQAGNTIAVGGHLTHQGELRFRLALQYLMRSKAKVLGAGAPGLSEEAFKSGRDELLLAATVGKLLNPKLQLLGTGEFKSVSENEYAETGAGYRPKASYVGFGGGLGYQFSVGVSGSVMATYYFGTVADDIDQTGLGLVLALTYRYW